MSRGNSADKTTPRAPLENATPEFVPKAKISNNPPMLPSGSPKDKPKNHKLELSIELCLELAIALYQLGAEQMDLPHDFQLGLFLWVVATALAIRMFWILPKMERLKWYIKAPTATLAVGLLIYWAWTPVTNAYKTSHYVPPGYTVVGHVSIASPKDGWFSFSGFNPDSDNVFRQTVKTENLSRVQDYFNIIIAERVDDHSTDEMSDASIEKSESFSILLPSLTVDIALSKNFVQRIFPDKPREGISYAAVKSYLIVSPKGITPKEIKTLSDVPHLGGYILGTLTSNVSISQRILHKDTTLPTAPPVSSADDSVTRAIQQRLSDFITSGNELRDGWTKRLGGSEEAQRPSAIAIQSWHKEVEDYLRTIPRGKLYLVRFQNKITRPAEYPVGINLNMAGYWDLLESDLARLNEFILDPDLGIP